MASDLAYTSCMRFGGDSLQKFEGKGCPGLHVPIPYIGFVSLALHVLFYPRY